jgi:hypothetical protein
MDGRRYPTVVPTSSLLEAKRATLRSHDMGMGANGALRRAPRPPAIAKAANMSHRQRHDQTKSGPDPRLLR